MYGSDVCYVCMEGRCGKVCYLGCVILLRTSAPRGVYCVCVCVCVLVCVVWCAKGVWCNLVLTRIEGSYS